MIISNDIKRSIKSSPSPKETQKFKVSSSLGHLLCYSRLSNTPAKIAAPSVTQRYPKVTLVTEAPPALKPFCLSLMDHQSDQKSSWNIWDNYIYHQIIYKAIHGFQVPSGLKVCHDTNQPKFLRRKSVVFSHLAFWCFWIQYFFSVAVAKPFFKTFEHWPVIKLANLLCRQVLPRNKRSRICYLRMFFSKKKLLPNDRSENWNSKNSNWNSKQLSLLPLRHSLAFCIGQAPNEISL